MLVLWSGFVICTLAIVYSGIRLSKYGDIIAEKSGLGRAWIGLVLMASVTSLSLSADSDRLLENKFREETEWNSGRR